MKLFQFWVATLLLPHLLFAGFEIGGDFSYFTPQLTTRVYPLLANKQSTNFSGALYTGYAHITVGLPQLVTIGFGPTLAFANQNSVDEVTIEEVSISRFGGDAKIQIESIPLVSPYVRFSLGKDTISWIDRGSVGTGRYIAESTAGGLYYSLMLGAQFPFSAEFALYAQAGYTASPGSRMLSRSYAVDGVRQTINVPGDTDTGYSGWVFGAGGRLSF